PARRRGSSRSTADRRPSTENRSACSTRSSSTSTGLGEQLRAQLVAALIDADADRQPPVRRELGEVDLERAAGLAARGPAGSESAAAVDILVRGRCRLACAALLRIGRRGRGQLRRALAWRLGGRRGGALSSIL